MAGGAPSNFAVYANGQLAPNDTAYAGTHYGATNASAPGGGIFEDISGLTINSGDTYCGSAELRDQLNETGASGQFVIWLLGGGGNENTHVAYANLGHGTNWTQSSDCVTATTSHTDVRIQFYPNPGTPTLDIDAVDLHAALNIQALAITQNGGFESGYSPWQEAPNANFAVYANGQLAPNDTAYAGTHYGATNASAPGGGIFEDISGLTINSGDTYCGSAELRDQLNETGASGQFVIWLLGGGGNENTHVAYANLGHGTNWTQSSDCVTATTSHTDVRIQFYPNPGTPTLDIDAVDVAQV